MDPLSITASSVAIITICSQVTNIVTRWVTNVRNVDSTIKKLAKEVDILCTVLAAVKETFERPGLGAIIALNTEGQLWPCISDILDNCRGTLRKLRKTLQELDSEVESANLMQKGVRHVRLGNRKELITGLLGQVHSYHGMLQMLLQCTNICVTLHESMHNRAAHAEILRQLSTIKSEVHQLKDGTGLSAIAKDSNLEQPSQSNNGPRSNERRSLNDVLENTIHSVEDFVDDSVSTVYARSASVSEAFGSWSREALLPTPSRFRRAWTNSEVECWPSSSRKNSLKDISASEDYSGTDSGEDDTRDWYTVSKDLDVSEAQRFICYASWHGLNELLDWLITSYGHLINEFEDFDGKDSTRWSPLLLAACKGHCSTMSLLLRNGAQIDAEDRHGITPLLLALVQGREDAALLLIQSGARIINLLPGCSTDLLTLAALHNCVKVMEHLLLRGDTETSNSLDRSSSLHWAVFAGSLEAAIFLLDYGFDIEARDEDGWTPLMLACTNLMEMMTNGNKWTWSVRSQPVVFVRLLLQRGADVNAIAQQSKMTPLRVAIQYKKFDVLPLLLEYGVKIDIKSRLWLLAHAKDLGLELEKQERAVKYSRR